jgi:hypothetical protein
MSQNEVATTKPETGSPKEVAEETASVAIVVNDAQAAKPSSEVKEGALEDSVSTTPAASVNVVLSPPKTTEELIAARALKRAARKTAVHEKAEGHKRAVSHSSIACSLFLIVRDRETCCSKPRNTKPRFHTI